MFGGKMKVRIWGSPLTATFKRLLVKRDRCRYTSLFESLLPFDGQAKIEPGRRLAVHLYGGWGGV